MTKRKRKRGHCDICKKKIDLDEIYKGVCEDCLKNILDDHEKMLIREREPKYKL